MHAHIRTYKHTCTHAPTCIHPHTYTHTHPYIHAYMRRYVRAPCITPPPPHPPTHAQHLLLVSEKELERVLCVHVQLEAHVVCHLQPTYIHTYIHKAHVVCHLQPTYIHTYIHKAHVVCHLQPASLHGKRTHSIVREHREHNERTHSVVREHGSAHMRHLSGHMRDN